MAREIILPDEWTPNPDRNGKSQDWHASILREIACQLGVESDAFYPLFEAAAKIEMYRDGEPYEKAIERHG